MAEVTASILVVGTTTSLGMGNTDTRLLLGPGYFVLHGDTVMEHINVPRTREWLVGSAPAGNDVTQLSAHRG